MKVSTKNNLIDKSIILAGGFGTRLRDRVDDRPKALTEIHGKPFLYYQIEWLKKQKIRNILIATHYLSEQIEDFISNYDKSPTNISSIREEKPLGTGGAVKNVAKQSGLEGLFLILNGDTFFNFSLEQALSKSSSSQSGNTVFASFEKDVSRFGEIITDGDSVIEFKQATGEKKPGLVNLGAYLIETKDIISYEKEVFSMEIDFFPHLIKKRKLFVSLINEQNSFYDFGTKDAFDMIDQVRIINNDEI